MSIGVARKKVPISVGCSLTFRVGPGVVVPKRNRSRIAGWIRDKRGGLTRRIRDLDTDVSPSMSKEASTDTWVGLMTSLGKKVGSSSDPTTFNRRSTPFKINKFKIQARLVFNLCKVCTHTRSFRV